MINVYLRSSSFNTYDFCQFKFFLDYVLGLPSEPNKKAVIGTIVHKCLELLAQWKLCRQTGRLEYLDKETGILINSLVEPDYEGILNAAYERLKNEVTHKPWEAADRKKCSELLTQALTYNGGVYSPLNQEIIEPEVFFDFEIDKPWAQFEYKLGEQIIKGRLALKGSLDLIIRDINDTYHLIDYKTGAEMKDWNTGKLKTFDDFMEDPQLCIYFYALNKLFPDAKRFLVTIFYIQAGGPVTLPFETSSLPEIENRIKNRFEEIQKNQSPKLIFPDFKCKYLCWHGRFNKNGEKVDYGSSVCAAMSKEMLKLGVERVTLAHARDLTYSEYRGGGKTITGEPA